MDADSEFKIQDSEFKIENSEKPKIAAGFYRRVLDILSQEKIEADGKVVAELISKYFPDYRRVLNELQRYSVGGVIDKGILSSVSDGQMSDMIAALKNKNFEGAKKWIVNNLDNDPTKIFKTIYESLYEKLEPNSVPQLVLHLAKYQYQFVDSRQTTFGSMMSFLP